MVVISPDEPACLPNKQHDWERPLWLLGGCDDNPGVWSNNHGGVIITECCMTCGCKKVTDTSATRPSNGTRGWITHVYEAGFYAEELAARDADQSEDE